MKVRFFLCKTCGNIVVKLVDSGVTPVCCGKEMVELKANETDSVSEKHLPVIDVECDGKVCVNIGELPHPMTKEHWIEFVVLETLKGGQIRYLKDCDHAHAEFRLACGDKPVAVYAYCNLHGLWMKKMAK